jgi:diguanylate cyclase (GGDEF)-like protein/PAS domain S-box-containing protein
MDHPLLPKMMDLLVDTICVVDEQGRYIFVSAACEHLFGYTPQELIGRNMIDLVHPEDRQRTLEAAANVMRGRSHVHFENRYVRKDGGIVDIMWSACWSQTDRVRMAVARDVTALKRAQRVQNALYRISEAAHAADGLFELYRRIHRVIADLLPADNFFVARYDAAGDTLSFPYFVDEREPKPQPGPLDADTPLAGVIRSGQALLTHCGAALDAWLGVPLISRNDVMGALVMRTYSAGSGYTCQDRDLMRFVSSQIAAVIERKHAEVRLHHLARHDPLTELPNRVLFHDRLETALKRARRDSEYLALLYIDLNGFKPINDTHGHEMGDLLLREVARRLARCVRASDTVGRMGGDEFTVLLIDIRERACADAMMEKIRAAIEAPFELNGQTLKVSASIGAAVYPEHGGTRAQLFRHADGSMYAAKRRKKGTASIH